MNMAQDAIKRLDEQLNCSVCLDTFINPKILHCGHVNCQTCLRRLVERNQQGELVVSCPQCRRITPVPGNGTAGLQSAFHINCMMGIRQSFRNMTTRQLSRPNLQANLSDTNAENDSSRRKKKTCSDHPNKVLDLYCLECGVLVCTLCLTRAGKHSGHDVIELSEAFEKAKEEIQRAMEPLKTQLSDINKALKGVDERHGIVTDQRAVIEAEIHKAVDRLQETLQARKAELLRQLDSTTSEKLKNLAAQHDQIETSQIRLDNTLEFINKSLETSSQDELVMGKEKLMQQVNDLTGVVFQPECHMPNTEADMMFSVSADVTTTCQNFGQVSVRGQKLPDLSKCQISGIGLKEAIVDKESSITFSAFNCANKPCDSPIEMLACEIVSEMTGAKIKAKVKQKDKNVYEITYQPRVKGRHLLSVTVDGKHVMNSPFHVHAKLPVRMIRDSVMAIRDVNRPWGAAFNLSGDLVVSEYDGHCISTYGINGKKIFSFGSFGNKVGQLGCPCGVAVDNIGNIFVADSHNRRIQKFTPNGQFLTAAGDNILRCAMPLGLAFNPINGNLYMVDAGFTVTIVNSDLTKRYGAFSKYGISRGELNKPYGIACDAKGRVYVADTENRRVQVFTADGHSLKEFGKNDLKKPVGIAVGRDECVYVSDEGNRRIAVFGSDGVLVKSFGWSSDQEKELNGVRGVAVDPDGVVYVCDRNNRRVLVF